jgi:uncharacterized protein (DUF302 family)
LYGFQTVYVQDGQVGLSPLARSQSIQWQSGFDVVHRFRETRARDTNADRRAKERPMNASEPANGELVTLPSAHAVGETVGRLKALLGQKNIHVFAHIDHAAAAEQVGLSLRPTQLLIFGNPQAGTPLMQSRQTIGLDLPLRVLAWEDGEGKVWLTYRRPEFLARRHQVAGHDAAVKALDDGLAALARAATAR